VQGGGQHPVVADQHHQLDRLPLVERVAQPGPGPVGQVVVRQQLVGRLEQQQVTTGPAAETAPLDALDLLRGEAGAPAQTAVLGELVLAAAGCADAQDHQLGLAAGEPAR
jgi:hypothetical protein